MVCKDKIKRIRKSIRKGKDIFKGEVDNTSIKFQYEIYGCRRSRDGERVEFNIRVYDYQYYSFKHLEWLGPGSEISIVTLLKIKSRLVDEWNFFFKGTFDIGYLDFGVGEIIHYKR